MGLAGRELVLHAEAVGNLGMHVVDGTALEGRLLRRAADGDAPVVFGIAVSRHVELFGAHGVGEQYVGVLGRVRHEGVAHDDELALLLVGERFEDAVDVTVLVGDAVAGVVPEELDAVFRRLDLGGSGGCLGILRAHEERELVGRVELLLEIRTLGDALEPRIARYLGVDHVHGHAVGVVVGRRDGPDGRSRWFGLAHAGVRALATEIARQEREHAHRARGRLAVAVALQTPALHDVDAIGLVQLAGELADGLGGNERDSGGPLGRLLDLVVAGSHDVVVVRLVLALGRCGHGLLIVALAVPVQEVEVDPALLDELVGNAGDECRVRARANG